MSSGKRSNPPCVMVVEDEVLVRMLLADHLRDRDFRVVEAANAEEAIGLLEHEPELAAVITDVRMPGRMNGLELARLIQCRWPHVKVFITSGYFDPTNNGLPATASFIRKPYKPQTIANQLRAEFG